MNARLSFVALGSLLAGCSGEAPPPTSPAPQPSAIPTTLASAQVVTRPAFDNPGGMWLPEQIPAQAAQLKALGLAIDPASLGDLTKHPMAAIVSLGGCSASFVSSDGLVITNHHCSLPYLQFASDKEHNRLRDGYTAGARGEELQGPPTARVFVTRAMTDVTTTMRDGLERITDDRARHDEIEKRETKVVDACERGKKGVRCAVASFWGGAGYRLIEQLEIKDVRLVFAPAESVGDFGGEIDNWRWPRHDADVAILRAYVGKDGTPAEYAKDNVAYHPTDVLTIAPSALEEGDLVMVAGYPARTERLLSAAETNETLDAIYPRSIAFDSENIELLEALKKQAPELEIKTATYLRSLNNALTNTKGLVEGLSKGGVAAGREKSEKELEGFIVADPARAKAYGDVVPKMKALVEARAKTRVADAELAETMRMTQLLAAATTIVKMAEERPKPDADRETDFQARNQQRRIDALDALERKYDRRLDAALLELQMHRAIRDVKEKRPALVDVVVGKDAKSDAKIKAAIEALYAKTTLEDAATRRKLFETATTKELEKERDPLIKLALALRPLQKAAQDRADAFSGAMALLRPRYVEAMQKMTPGPLAPDANSTLRITYGTVKPLGDWKAFTTMDELLKKVTGKAPFDPPPAFLEAAKKPENARLRIDFLSDVDTTGGNSGSPTLNAKGELVGLLFDGTYESVASDWTYIPKITRSIHVDIGYVEWLLKNSAGAGWILDEMKPMR